MSSFTDELTVTHLDANWKLWRVERDFVYEVGAKGSGQTISVPKGFITDGASVPQLFWAVLPAWGSYSRAALVHDYLCYLLHKGTPHAEAPTRKRADQIFWEAMKVCGTSWPVRAFMYVGVRIGDYSNKLPWASKNIVSTVNS
jgi:Protein of unknown function (DUF1353)